MQKQLDACPEPQVCFGTIQIDALTLDVFEHQIGLTQFGDTSIQEARDIGMIQPCEKFAIEESSEYIQEYWQLCENHMVGHAPRAPLFDELRGTQIQLEEYRNRLDTSGTYNERRLQIEESARAEELTVVNPGVPSPDCSSADSVAVAEAPPKKSAYLDD